MSRNRFVTNRRSIPQKKSIRQIIDIDGYPKVSTPLNKSLREALKKLAKSCADNYAETDGATSAPSGIGRATAGYGNLVSPNRLKRSKRRKK